MDPLHEGLRWLDRDLEEHGISYEERQRASDEFKDGFFRMVAIEEFGWLGRWMPSFLCGILIPIKYLGIPIGVAIGLYHLVRFLA